MDFLLSRQMKEYASVLLLLISFFTAPAALRAQELRTDSEVPALDICGDARTFTVRIGQGATACPEGRLQIVLPEGIRYVAGSAQVDGTDATESSVTQQGATVHVNVPSGPTTGEVVVTFEAYALCESLDLAPDAREVDYTFSGCAGPPQTDHSNTINLRFAVLNTSVAPNISQGIIGTEITRTITVRNSGNAPITGFTVAPTYGAGLERVSADLSSGWSYDDATGLYTYAGTLASGNATVSFQETVRITDCGDLTSSYRAYYGCESECAAGTNEVANPAISIDGNIRPNLSIAHTTVPTVTCFNASYTHTWTIRNNGQGVASGIALTLGTTEGGGASYIVQGSISATKDGSAVTITPTYSNQITANAFGTAGQYQEALASIAGDLLPGEAIVLTFEQYYAAPAPNTDCTSRPNSFNMGTTYRSATYIHPNGCDGSGNPPTYTIGSANAKSNQWYAFGGQNIGEIDIVEGLTYEADFRVDNWSIPAEGLGADAYFEVTIELSPSVAAGLSSGDIRLFNGTDYLEAETHFAVTGSGNTYTLRIDRGTAGIWAADGALSLGGGAWRLQFPLELDCPADAAWYRISGAFSKGGECTDVIEFGCNEVALNPHCGEDCGAGGLDNGAARLMRITMGYADLGNDARPDDGTLLDPGAANMQNRSFIGGDIVEISQVGTVMASSTVNPDNTWADGQFSVQSPSALASEAVPSSGKVVVTRNNVNYVATGLTVDVSGNNFSVSLAEALSSLGLPGDEYQEGDVITTSLRIRPMSLSHATTLYEFPTTYHLTHNNQNYACDEGYRATGYSGNTSLAVSQTGNGNIAGCESSAKTYGIDLTIAGRMARNALFINEFREIAVPKSVTMEVPAGLTMTGYTVRLVNNALGNALSTTVTDLSISGASHTISESDMQGILTTLKGGAAGMNIDEGFRMEILPIVIPNCDAATQETIRVTSVVNGTFRHGNTNYYNEDVTTSEVNLVYNTHNDQLAFSSVQPNVNTLTGEIEWLVSVQNHSNFRTFGNAWLAKSGGNDDVIITEVMEIDNLINQVPVSGVAVDEANGIFQLGNVSWSTTRHFRVTASYAVCGPGTLQVSYGQGCEGYPTTISGPCASTAPLALSYTPVEAQLQTAIVQHPDAGGRPALCEPLDYILEINNSGGLAKNLKLTIPMTGIVGLKYNAGSLRISSVMSSESSDPDAELTIDIDDANVVVTADAIEITIPSDGLEKLEQAERFYVGLQLMTEGCDFKSGQRVFFAPSGDNFCGSAISEGRITGVGSNRIIMDGAPENEPELEITADASINLIESGDDLSASYNMTIDNIGTVHPATGTADASGYVYSFNIKLPADWTIVDPQGIVDPALAEFKELDPEKGYVFDLVANIEATNQLNIENALLTYTGDATLLACDEYLGEIESSVFSFFEPASVCDPEVECDMELITTENSTPFRLTSPSAPTGEDELVFCETAEATLADAAAELDNVGILVWFDADGDELLSTTLLEDGVTYYAANRLIDGSICLSDRHAVTVQIDEQPVANAGPDQALVNQTAFTMAGNAPTGNQTGAWTFVSGTDRGGNALSAGDVSIALPNALNSAVTIPLGASVTLAWTLTNGTCEDTDEVIINSLYGELTLEKTGTFNDDGDGDSAGDGFAQVDETITYTFTVENTGDVTLEDLTIDDAIIGVGGLEVTPSTLEPGETGTAEYVYTITQADINAGGVWNIALVTGYNPEDPDTPVTDESEDPTPMDPSDPDYPGEGPDPDCDDCTITPLPRDPKLDLLKDGELTDPDADLVAGETTITYTFTVENTGNVTLEDLTIDDAIIGVSGLEVTPSTLQPGETGTAEYEYTITQADINAGGVWNIALVTGYNPNDPDTPVTDESEDPTPMDSSDPDYPGEGPDPDCDDCTITPLPRDPKLELLKDGELTDPDADLVAGETTITYTFTVENTGNVTLEDLTIDDAIIGVSGLEVTPSTLQPGETGTAEYEYTITQADINAGGVWNIALVTGYNPEDPDTPVTDESEDPTPMDPSDPGYPGEGPDPDCDDCTITPLPRDPQVRLYKSGEHDDADENGIATAGEQIVYTFTVENTGNVTLENLVVDDAIIGVSGLEVSPSTLQPGEHGTATARYTITQEDLDAGGVWNIALVTGYNPEDPDTPVTDESEDPNPLDPDDPDYPGEGPDPDCDDCTITPLPQRPDLTVTKVADREEVIELGEEVWYTITVTNRGNVTLRHVVVTDILFPDWSETIPVLEPGEERSYTLAYVAEQEDFNAGRIINVAAATGEEPNGEDVPAETPEVTVPIRYINNLVVTKDADLSVVDREGEIITYIITVSNLGNQPLSNVTVVDPLTGMSETIAELGVGETETFTTEYVVTLDDFLTLTEIVNVVNATGRTPQGDPVDGSDEETVRLTPRELFIPNVFTPNGDGRNDTFEIVGHENYDRIDLVIINRWGNEVYRSEDYRNEWDGRGLNDGTYFYIIEAIRGNTMTVFKGNVLIKRN